MKKQLQKSLINDRLIVALENLYHNATPHHPYAQISDSAESLYEEWFSDAASFEIEHINGGGAHGLNSSLIPSYCQHPYVPKEMDCKSPHFISKWCLFMRQKALREINKYARHERIIEYGKLYTWGRGGRTLAPDELIRQRGGSSFSIKNPEDLTLTLEEKTDMILTLEAFNASVEEWNSAENLREMWLEFYSDHFDNSHSDDYEKLAQ